MNPEPRYKKGGRIGDRYQVHQTLMGGMGLVYLCHNHQEDHSLALKTFCPELLSNRAARDRFLREGATWVNLGRPSSYCALLPGHTRLGWKSTWR